MKTTIRKESTEDYLMSHLEVCKTKEELVFAFWMYWVDSVVTNSIDFQKVLACSSVNKWFMIELQKEELIFKITVTSYPFEIRGKDKDWLYCKCISTLMSRFPKSLLESAKKNESKKQPTLIPIEQQN